MAFARWARVGTSWPVVAGLAACGVLAAAAPAGAAVLNASPTGSGTACSTASPCTIQQAVTQSNASTAEDDEISLASGDYVLTAGLSFTDAASMHGPPGEAPARITTATADVTMTTVNGADAVVAFTDLDLVNEAATGTGRVIDVTSLANLTLERVKVQLKGAGVAMNVSGAPELTMRNSSVHSASSADHAVVVTLSAHATFIGSTLVKVGGGGSALQVTSPTINGASADVTGSIIDGPVGVSGIGAVARVDHSNYDGATAPPGVVPGDGNQTASPPVFVNRTAGDLHQTGASPTVNAGIADPDAARDFEGEPRPNGSAPDIGADELYPGSDQHYATPGAVARGTCSTPATACGIYWATESVTANDDSVVLLPGDYSMSRTLAVTKRIDVHGQDGSPRPRLFGAPAGPVVSVTAGPGTRVADLDVEHTGSPGTAIESTGTANPTGGAVLFEGIRARAQGAAAQAIELGSGDTLRNSIAWVPIGPSAQAVAVNGAAGTVSTEIRNVTAFAPFGIGVELDGSGPDALLMRNTVAFGQIGIRALGAGGLADVDVGFSNYPNFATNGDGNGRVMGPNNQVAVAPEFVDTVHGDFHQKLGSVTIDAGFNSPGANGPTDIDGDARRLGQNTDIGADEFRPLPTARTDAATGVGQDSATLHGGASPVGLTTSVHFEYGTTTSYGAETAPQDIGSGTTSVDFEAAVSGLAPSTTYHFRTVATSSGGTTVGSDQEFTTAAAPAVPGPPGGGGGPPAGGPPGGGPGPTVADRLAPGIQSFSITRRSFKRGARGVAFRYALTEAARASIVIERKTTGRRVGRRCVKQTRRNAKRRKCTLYVKAGTLSQSGKAGSNSLAFTGKVGRKSLAVGSYRATISATDAAGNTSRTRAVSFKIVRR